MGQTVSQKQRFSASGRISVGSSTGDEAAAASLRAAVERGEKLGKLGDATQVLADEAENFADLASQLRKQNERPFFGLF